MPASIRVLHVDDEPDLADLTAQFLEGQDERFSVNTATRADEALTRLREDEFDCIVSDLDMPDQNGIQFLESVRDDFPDLPFILYTGKGSEEVASEAISAGVTEYLQKESGTGQYDVLGNRIKNAVENYHTQHELRDREHRLNLFFEQSPLGVIRWDDEFTFARVNAAARDILGYAEGELVGQPWEVVIPEANREEIADVVVADLLADEGGYHSINENVRKDGEVIVCEWYNWVVTGENDDVVAVFSQFQDISDRTEHERELDELAQYNREIVENAPVGLFRLDDQLRITYENQRAEEIVGVPDGANESPAIGRDIRDLPSVQDTNAVEALNRLEAGETVSFDTAFESIFGEESYLTGKGVPLFEDGTVTGAIIMVVDITERKEREQAIQDLHRVTDAIMAATSADAIAEITVDAVRDILEMSANGVHLYDETEDGLVPVAWTDRTEAIVGEPPTFAPGEGLAGTAFETGEPQIHDDISTVDDRFNPDTDVRSQIIYPLGDRGVLVIGSPEPDAFDDIDISLSGTIATHATTALERVTRQEELARRQKLFEAILETSIDGILVIDKNREYVTWNQQFIDLWGVPAELIEEEPEAVGLDYILDNIDQPQEFIDKVEYLYEHPNEESRDEIQLTDGRVFDRYSAPVEADDGTYFGRVWFFRDITERETREQELARQNNRLAEFASVVSHDLRNPLNVAQGRVNLAREQRDSEHLDSAATAIDRSLALIDDLLDLAREGEQVGDVEPVELAELCAECWQNVETADATLVTETDRTIRADPGRLTQLLENLMRNAIEHGGADVTVSIGALDEGFSIADDGPGIPEADRDRVFNPGYSSEAEGTGFGLNIVQEIAEAHGWNVRVTDSETGGARFEITGVEFDG